MPTKTLLIVPALILGTISAVGCATKGYVRAQVQPVNSKVDQVSEQTQTQFKQTNGRLDDTNQQLQQTQTNLAATKETADAADSRATQALGGLDKANGQIGQLNDVVGNIDDYKMSDQATVLFAFDKDALTPDDQAALDKLANDVQGAKRYLITVEGFTDQTGPVSYNDQLSRRRAESVIRYLVGQHNIPIYHIHMVGLGKEQLVDSGRTREDRKQSRRVEVGFYTAPTLAAQQQTAGQ